MKYSGLESAGSRVYTYIYIYDMPFGAILELDCWILELQMEQS